MNFEPVAPDTLPAVALRETCRLAAGRVPLWPYHRRRLASGGCGEAMLLAADGLVEREAAGWTGVDSSRLRLTLVAGSDGSITARVQRRLSSLDVPHGPVAVRVDSDTAIPPILPAGAAKPVDRAWWDEAQRRARAAGGDQAIIVSPDGFVIDGGTASVWIVEDGAVVTPPAPPAVAGVARAYLLDALAETGESARIEPVSWERFEAADEAFISNAFGGCVAVRGRGGERAHAVAGLLAAIWAD
jgi:branched-subunit amino acid aminotransferase/4-amino-4-deoxychorismate lyase